MLYFYIELKEIICAKWFLLYSVIFGGVIVLMFTFGIADSMFWGMTGLTRLVITYMQFCIVVLPILILIVTVRAISADRETHSLEYVLSQPLSLASYYWGKVCSRFMMIFFPVFGALIFLLVWGVIQKLSVPWKLVAYYSALLIALNWCFSGFGIFISVFAKKQESANAIAFLVWLGLIVFLDFILIGLLLRYHLMKELVVSLALLNPIQVFRIAVMASFDPEISMIGPSSYLILDTIGLHFFMMSALIYPLALGTLFATLGYYSFKKRDLL